MAGAGKDLLILIQVNIKVDGTLQNECGYGCPHLDVLACVCTLFKRRINNRVLDDGDRIIYNRCDVCMHAPRASL